MRDRRWLGVLGVGMSLGMSLVASGCSSSSRAAVQGDGGTASTTPGFVGDTDGGISGSAACIPLASNFEVPNNNCDDDADGKVDNVSTCDDNLQIDGNAQDFAAALGICQRAEGDKWGLISATYTGGYTSTAAPNQLQHGILHKFGNVIKPREGSSLGVLSSGYAREFNGSSGADPFQNGEGMEGPSDAPPGFPKAAGGCDIADNVNDVIVFKLKVKAPTNAKGISFDFDFYSGEWPEYVCTRFNDGFASILTAKGFNSGNPDNISFDAQSNPVSVNNGFFDRCTPNTQTGCAGLKPVLKTAACAGGESELTGTGFYSPSTYCNDKQSTGGGATGWLTSSAPVQPGEEVSLELAIWDTGDAAYDSSVLLDHFRWEAGDTVTKTERPK